jgi:hypothetical protein
MKRIITFALATLPISGTALATPPAATGTAVTLTGGLPTGYQLFIPSTFQPSKQIDLLVHFHGDPATIWANHKYANLNSLVVTANLGALSGSYQTPYSANTSLFGTVLNEALAKARQQASIPDDAAWRKVAVSSFSAGYGAVREILKQPAYFNQITGLVMADTIYGSFTSASDHSPLDSQMVNFRAFAQQAAAGSKAMVVTHSQVQTFTYSNTAETADDLMAHVGVTPSPYNAIGLGGLQFYRHAAKGNFEVFGATGATATAHSLHLQNIGQWLDDLPLAVLPEPGVASLSLTAFAAVASRRRSRAPVRA